MRPEFKDIAFRDEEQAASTLERILADRGPHLTQHLAQALREAGDPTTTVVRLERYLEVSHGAGTTLDLMEAAFRFTQLIVTLFDQSHYLTDIVCRNPEYVSWLWLEADIEQTPARDAVVRELLHQVRALETFDAKCRSLRRFKRRAILRIAARDIVAHAPLASITEDLANLADASLEAAIESAREELVQRYGRPIDERTQAPSTFAVLAFGKLGGQELNFSSDIDLIFIYSGDGGTAGGTSGIVSNAEFYQKLGERVIKAIAEQTPEGHVFRVDMRLRPHGRVGPLAVSIDNAVSYYENYGRAWERQALIKARPAAGDLQLGQEFIERTRPFVFPRYFDDETLEDIRGVKEQTEEQTQAEGTTDIEVKLGRGGIRDIEFTVQVLQLLNGGRLPSLRTTNTLEAIDALSRHALLRPLEAQALARNYIFLREVEHRLQIEGSQQRHALPRDPAELTLLARRLGYRSGPSFMAEYRERCEENRAILERFITSEGSGNRWLIELLNSTSEAPPSLARLETMGFKEPARAREELVQLYGGSRERPHTLRVRQTFVAIAPMLLDAVSSCGDPDATLMRVERLLSNIRAPGVIYDILKADAGLCRYLVELVDNSEFLTETLIRDPGLFDIFGSSRALDHPATREELEGLVSDLSQAYDAEAALYRLHDGEMLRIGMRELFRDAGVIEIGHELTLLAEVCLAEALRKAREKTAERHGGTTAPFAVLALGKMGGRELGYGSDLDLVFVYDEDSPIESGMASSEYFANVASNTIRILKERTRYGVLYDVDARLRPDGKKGMLTISSARLHEYYTNEAQAWERLALMKVRAVAGDLEFAQAMEQHMRALAFARALDSDELANVEDIRQKLVAQAGPLDLKKQEGGIAEIEFAVRLLQLRHVAAHPELERGDVLGALEILVGKELLSREDYENLVGAYELFRRIENRIRMMTGRSGSALPASPQERANLAKRLGISGDLGEVVQQAKTLVHEAYARILGELGYSGRGTIGE